MKTSVLPSSLAVISLTMTSLSVFASGNSSGNYVNGHAPMLGMTTEAAILQSSNNSYGVSSGIGVATVSSNSLSLNQQLNVNQYLQSRNGKYRLYMQGDGNLVLRDTATFGMLWSSGTSGNGGGCIRFQSDGNLVIRNSAGVPIWSTDTEFDNADRLILNNNGALVIYSGPTAVWFVGNNPPAADTVPPTLDLNGSALISISLGSRYLDAGASASDDVDGDISASIAVSGSVNTNVAGLYTLTYSVSDDAGNTAMPVRRTVAVQAGRIGDIPTNGNSLNIGTLLYSGQYILSTSGQYRAKLQGDGRFVLRDLATNASLWSTGASNQNVSYIRFQGDGNLVAHNASGSAVWSTKTAGGYGDRLVVNNNGSLVIYQGDQVIWRVGNAASFDDSALSMDSQNASDNRATEQYPEQYLSLINTETADSVSSALMGQNGKRKTTAKRAYKDKQLCGQSQLQPSLHNTPPIVANIASNPYMLNTLPYSARWASHGLYCTKLQHYLEVDFASYMKAHYIMSPDTHEQFDLTNAELGYYSDKKENTPRYLSDGTLVVANLPCEFSKE